MSDKKPSFLGRLIKGVFTLAVLITIGLAFMYSEKVGRYPWGWEKSDLGGFADYVMMKGQEVKSGTLVLVEKVKDIEFGKKLDSLAAKYFGKDAAPDETDPATPVPAHPDAVSADPPAAPEYSEGEKLWKEGYDLRREGNRAEGAEQAALYQKAVDTWKKASPALQAELDAAKAAGEGNRAMQLEELLLSLNQQLGSVFKDTKMAE